MYMCDKGWLKVKMSKKTRLDGHVARKDYLVVLHNSFRISIWLGPNLMIVRTKGRYHLLKELEQLTHSWGTKSVAANKVIIKYKETMTDYR